MNQQKDLRERADVFRMRIAAGMLLFVPMAMPLLMMIPILQRKCVQLIESNQGICY